MNKIEKHRCKTCKTYFHVEELCPFNEICHDCERSLHKCPNCEKAGVYVPLKGDAHCIYCNETYHSDLFERTSSKNLPKIVICYNEALVLCNKCGRVVDSSDVEVENNTLYYVFVCDVCSTERREELIIKQN
jgi:hypothetical protein